MQDQNPAPILEAQDVSAGYGEVEILHGASAKVLPGEMVAVIGPNGAGKSTLLRAMFGLLTVRSGKVLCAAKTLQSSAERLVWKGLSYVPQVDNVFPSLTIMENLQMGAFVRGGGLRRAHRRGVRPLPRPRRAKGRDRRGVSPAGSGRCWPWPAP